MKKTIVLIFCLLFCKQFVFAQLCTGSLGDPIVNITFGANSPGPLKNGVTNMSYSFNDCPQDGSYTIRGSTSSCFNNTWYSFIHDHTGNPGGQFMLVNGSLTPSDFYVDTVKGLCGNTTFEFAAWVVNILRPGSCSGTGGSKPNLTFRIETANGTVLVKYDSGDIPTAGLVQWNQYGTFFKTPPGVGDLVLRITNNAPGGCGNDLALDDITFRPCGPTITSSIRNKPSADIGFCADDLSPLILDASSSNGFAGSTIQWQLSLDSGQVWTDIPGAQSISYTRKPTAAGFYEYRAVVAETANFSSVQCRVASTISTIRVFAVPVFVHKPFVTGCTGSDLLLETAQGSGYTYQWTGPNNFSSTIYDPVLLKTAYSDSGLYRVLVQTPEGCSNIDSFPLKVFPGVTAKVNVGTILCEGSSMILLASGGTVYNWSPSTGLSNTQIANPTASPVDSTVYKVIVANQYGCKDSAQTAINVFRNPIVSAGPDKKIFEGQSVLLDGRITGNLNSFYWLPQTFMSNSNSLTPMVTPTDTITYTLYALPGMGCPAVSDNVFVRVYKKLAVPNAFSPNGDGINDTWIVKGLETYPDAILRVYSRNGMVVFQSKAGDLIWDGTYQGKPLPLATYYYLIDLNIGLPPVSGWVVLLR